jgi:predicted Fe-Mo cluster-binding NifX family protein
MKIAISTDHDFVSAHFGRCPSYTIVEIEEGKVLSRAEIPNPGHQPGFLPQSLSNMGVRCIIAGGMGPRAQGLFSQKNIETIIGVQGKIGDVIEKFINKELEAGQDLCDHQHGGGHGLEQHRRFEQLPQSKGRKICITSEGEDLEANLDPKFGRAHYFLVVDPDTMMFEVLENPNKDVAQGAGIQTAQFISSKNVGTVLTGDCGPNALRVLQSSGIKVITGLSGKVEDIISKYKSQVE